MYQSVTLIGNLGADPESKHGSNGTHIVNFTLATTKKWKDQSGEMNEKTSWHRVTCFNKQADVALEYLKKGSKVFIVGTIDYGSYEKDGQKVYTTNILVNEFKFLDSKPATQEQKPAQQQQNYTSSDIPF